MLRQSARLTAIRGLSKLDTDAKDIEKIAELSKKTKRNIGNALIAAGVATPIAFATRGKLKLNKFMDMARKGALKSRDELDRAISSHIRKTKAKLPKYEWADITQSAQLRKMRTGSTKTPVLVAKDGKYLPSEGPGYFNQHDFITLGKDNILNPKILMHELGHAADPELANYMKRPGLRFRELFTGLINPEKTDMLKAELRAWDNAKILKGDALREAALDTYRNAVRGGAATMTVTPAAVLGGSMLRMKNREQK